LEPTVNLANLVELTRGGLVESVHSGAFAVCRANGACVAAAGDINRAIFPRSAIKALQSLPLVESGAADRYGFGDAEIALACASHSGTAGHADLAHAMLSRAGQTPAALACGAHDPKHEASARELARRGERFSPLHNNCSGKHAGMVCTCVHTGDPVEGYLDVKHPHQQRIAKVLHDFCGEDFKADRYGIDGCSAPNWALPVKALATAFATYVSGDGLSPDRRRATERIAKACMARPDMVAGPGRLDTTAMTALAGKVFMKTGAEGVYCGGFPALGLGFAVKIDDGAKRAAEAVTEAIIKTYLPDAPALGATGVTRNWQGIETGMTRVSDTTRRELGW
jgi:L-asparaginase II